jgi:hypothetical protein
MRNEMPENLTYATPAPARNGSRRFRIPIIALLAIMLVPYVALSPGCRRMFPGEALTPDEVLPATFGLPVAIFNYLVTRGR